ncbi:HAD-IA family hydrolase [candidate division FCPU426 bacterium]|nr:HAD-IA family hydrolase [candidate division FCPU426 bacterium]
MLVIPDGSLQHTKHKAVFFDAGNTLFEIQPSVGELYAQVAKEYGVRFKAGALETLFRKEWQRRSGGGHFTSPQSKGQERAWWYDLVKSVVDRLGGLKPFDAYFERLYDLFASEQVWRLFPEVPEVLKECRRRGVVVGIVSNWDSRLMTICDRLQLSGYCTFIIASAAVGIAKPDPAIFQLALERAGVTAQEAMHVGDSVEDDVYGARAAGVDALWIWRGVCRQAEGIAMTDSLRHVLELC